MSAQPRYEKKYVLSPQTYWRVRGIIPFGFHRDRFSCLGPDGKYLVRSLYYDTWGYQGYVDKVWGLPQRSKFRLRTYWDHIRDARFVSVEEKRRDYELISKIVTKVDLADYTKFMETGCWQDRSDPALQRFEACSRLAMLRPTVLVDYRREVYESRSHSDIRVSFDHCVRYCRSDTLFPQDSVLQQDLSSAIIMEIKTPRVDHPWLHELVMRAGLKAVVNSKYVNAIDHTPQAIWR